MFPDYLISLGISAVLAALQDAKTRRRFAAALAKIYVAIGVASATDQLLASEIESRQR